MTTRKQMAVNGVTPFLPEEIITDILKRLPVKSLIRFRCVCQHWKNLVKNPSFITDHLRHSDHHNPNFLFFPPSSYQRDYTAKLNLLNCEMQIRDLQKAPLIDYLWAGRFKIIGCSNGLLCVAIHRNELTRPPSYVLLWNPATKDVRGVPRPRIIDSCKFSCEFGFGFNSSLNDFKIVAIGDQIDRMGVYSLSRGSWKEIELENFPEDFTFFDVTAVSSNEAIFWNGLIIGEEIKGVIASFDTTKEVFTFIPWPTDTALNASRSLYYVNLTVYKDKLAIFHSGSDGSLWVWMMEEDIGSSRERWNWTKKFIGGHYPQMFNCVDTIWRNEIVIVGNTETRGKEGSKTHLCLVNLTTNEFKMIDGPQYCPAEFLNYVESLVPIFNIHNIEEPKIDVSRPGSNLWGEIWKLQIPERCKMFLWLALHKRLLTNVSRYKRGLSTDARCPICNGERETLLHVLRDCPATADLWKQLVPMNLWCMFTTKPFDEWVRLNICYRGKNQRADEWRHLFAIVCWWLWLRRNTAIFEGKMISNVSLQNSAMAMVHSMQDARTRYCTMPIRQQLQSTYGNHWRPPPAGQIKINANGAYSQCTNGVASGGLLRDEHSNFLRGFMFKGEDGDSISAELWGCIHGLKIAWDLGYKDVILEIDSADAVDLIRSPSNLAHEDRLLLDELKRVIDRHWNVDIHHISHWANAAADYLAKASLSSLPGFQIVLHADLELERILASDKT